MTAVERSNRIRVAPIALAMRALGILLAVTLLALPASASAAGLEVIGKSDLGGGGFNGEVATVGDTAIVGGGILPSAGTRAGFYNPSPCPGVNVKVVDLTSPSAPRVASQIDVPVGVTAFDVAALTVNTPSFKGDLAAVALVFCGAPGQLVNRGVAYYDVTDRGDPVFLGRYHADADAEDPADPVCGSPESQGERCAASQHQVKLVQRADGKVLSLSTEPFASASGTAFFPSGDLRIVDVTNPRNPTQVGSYPVGTEQPPRFGTNPYGFSNNGCRPFDAGYGPGTTPDGTRGLLAYLDQGLLTLDLANPAAPSLLGQLDPYGDRRDLEGNAAYVDYASSGGRQYALVGEADWIAPETRLSLSSGPTLPGRGFACEAMFTLFDPENTAQIYRKPGSRVPPASLPPAEIVYVGRGCPSDPYINNANVAGKIVLRDRIHVHTSGGVSCSIAAASKRAQDLGAVAVVNAQTSAQTPQAFSPDGDPAGLTIPTVMIDKPDADALRTALCPTFTPPPTGSGQAGTCTGGQTVRGSLVDSADNDGSPWGALRRIDITNPAAPRSAGAYTTPRSHTFPPPDLGVYSAHHAVSRGGRAYAAWNSDGLRVLDITGPDLREVASFVPPDTPDPRGAIPSKAYVTGVDLTPGGDIVITDINSGLYVLRAPGGGGGGGAAEGINALSECRNLTANLIRGTAASNSIVGTLRSDRIFAGTGDDEVDGLAGDDCIDLGPGTDRGQGGSGRDVLVGGLGADRMGGSSGGDRLHGGSARDRLNGGFGNDRLHGQSGADRIFGERGRDRINGGGSRDRILGGSSSDRIAGDQGNDRINGNSGNDVIKGNSGRDRLLGSSGRDRISGGSRNDRIHVRDGQRDRVNCGSGGGDVVIADRIDRVARNCERVRRRG